MEYMLVFLESKEDFAARSEDPKTSPYWAAWMAYGKAMAEAGVTKGIGNALQPPETATVVRLKDGKRLVQDGPFASAKEQLGGYMIIEVPGLDQALEWAARSPAAVRGAVEVRPVLDIECGD
ncbi:MAG TPA: YciI family protein [Candidatus Limnocylindria bacterium]|nr:YciI family protein [Candidatus Limnocylindria bacterium]